MPFEKDLSSFCDWLVKAGGGSLLSMLKRVSNASIFAVIAGALLRQCLDSPETARQPVDYSLIAASFLQSNSAGKP